MDGSPFGKLPPELRNRVYELVLANNEVFEITTTAFGPDFARPRSTPQYVKMHPVAMTVTCKKMRAECTQLFYSGNTFSFSFTADPCYHGPQNHSKRELWIFSRFRKAIGTLNAAALRSIIIKFPEVSIYNGVDAQQTAARMHTTIKVLRSSGFKIPHCVVKATLKYNRDWPIDFPFWDFQPDDGLYHFEADVHDATKSIRAAIADVERVASEIDSDFSPDTARIMICFLRDIADHRI